MGCGSSSSSAGSTGEFGQSSSLREEKYRQKGDGAGGGTGGGDNNGDPSALTATHADDDDSSDDSSNAAIPGSRLDGKPGTSGAGSPTVKFVPAGEDTSPLDGLACRLSELHRYVTRHRLWSDEAAAQKFGSMAAALPPLCQRAVRTALDAPAALAMPSPVHRRSGSQGGRDDEDEDDEEDDGIHLYEDSVHSIENLVSSLHLDGASPRKALRTAPAATATASASPAAAADNTSPAQGGGDVTEDFVSPPASDYANPCRPRRLSASNRSSAGHTTGDNMSFSRLSSYSQILSDIAHGRGSPQGGPLRVNARSPCSGSSLRREIRTGQSWRDPPDARSRPGSVPASPVAAACSSLRGGGDATDAQSPLETLLLSAAEIVRLTTGNPLHICVAVAREARQLLQSESCTLWLLTGGRLEAFLEPESGSTSGTWQEGADASGEENSEKRKDVEEVPHVSTVVEVSGLDARSPECEVMKTMLPVHYRADAEGDYVCVHSEKKSVQEAVYYPILHEQTLLGIFKAANKGDLHDADFTSDSLNLLGSLLLFAAVSLKNCTLCKELEEAVADTQDLLTMTRDLTCCEMDASKLLECILTTAQRLVHSEHCRLLIPSRDGSSFITTDSRTEHTLTTPISEGIEGYVFETDQTVNTRSARDHPRYVDTLDAATGVESQSMLCMPIKQQGVTVAVAQLLNKQGSVPFTDKDERLFSDFSGFCGTYIKNCQTHEEVKREQRTTKEFLNAVEGLQAVDLTDIQTMCKTIMEKAGVLVECEQQDVWIVDKEHHTLQSVTKSTAAPINKTVAGECVCSGTILNYDDVLKQSDKAVSDPLLASITGLVPQTYLCIPMFSLDKEVIGVTQMINKVSGGAFSREDTKVMQLFSGFAAMCLRNAELIDFMKKASNAHSNLMRAMSSVGPKSLGGVKAMGGPGGAESLLPFKVDLTAEEKDQSVLWGFRVHDYHLRSAKHSRLPKIALHVIDQFGMTTAFKTTQERLLRFIVAVKRKYRHVSYHNFTHAFDVMHAIACYLRALPEGKYMTKLDCFALLITALCHDIDHMGLNNSFQMKAETPLGVLSSNAGSKSIMEVHHCNLTIDILSDPSTNVFEGLTQAEAKAVWRTVIECILGTDMARHQEILQQFSEVMKAFDVSQSAHRRVFMTMLLKMADISNVTRPFDLSKTWGHMITQEFISQGDSERQMGIEVSVHTNLELAKSQLSFMSAVVEPMYKIAASSIPELHFLVENLQDNRAAWESELATMGPLRQSAPPPPPPPPPSEPTTIPIPIPSPDCCAAAAASSEET